MVGELKVMVMYEWDLTGYSRVDHDSLVRGLIDERD